MAEAASSGASADDAYMRDRVKGTPSATSLLGILQRHGLSYDVLELFAAYCTAHRNGSLTLHCINGVVTSYEIRVCGKATPREPLHNLTKG